MTKSYIKRNLRGKNLELYKQGLKPITQHEHEMLMGILLGDASMQMMSGNQLSNIKIEQGSKNLDYVNHLYEILER